MVMNDEVTQTITDEFQTFAIEWGIDEIRWYIDGSHVHTLNLLHTWAYTTDNDQILIYNDGPFNQPMKIAFETRSFNPDGLSEICLEEKS